MRQLQLALSLATVLSLAFASTSDAKSEPRSSPPATTWKVLGKTYCLGNVPMPTTCDAHFLRPKNVVTLVGRTWCFGDAPGVICDVTIPSEQRRESPLARWVRELGRKLGEQRTLRSASN